jgi:glycosyltransferase involved in cell wall biosynthesis
MRIIYIHQYFLTPVEGGATRSYHLAKGFVEHGIDVEMITTHNHPYYDFKLIDGIKVHYLPIQYDQKFGFLKRIWAFFAFVSQCKKFLKKIPRPDFLYITSTPLSTGMVGLWAKRKFALPYIFEVRDLWPDAPVQVGAIKNPLLKKYLYALEKKIYRHALKIIALSPGIADSIRKKCPKCDLHIVPNFADGEIFYPVAKSTQVLSKYGLAARLTITYAGAIGKVNAVAEILDLALEAQSKSLPYQFIVMGKGSELSALLQKAKLLKLKNFYFIPFGSKKAVAEVLGISDLCFISFDHLPVLKTNSPNKFFDALATGKAVIVNHKGWVNKLVKNHQLGFYYDPQHPSEGIKKLQELDTDPKLLQVMQKNSRMLFEQNFTKEWAISHLIAIFSNNKGDNETKGGAYILTA